MFLIEAGWSVNIIMQTGLQSINGLRNHKGGFLGHPADPEFLKLISSLRRLQAAGVLGIGLRREKDNEEATMLLFYPRRLTAELALDAPS